MVNDIGAEPPKCGVKGCNNNAAMLIGKVFMCGNCVMEYQKHKQEIEAQEQEKILKLMEKE